MINQNYTAVKTAMLLHVPFFASLLMDIMDVKVGKFPNVFPAGNETMATDGKNIWIDEDFLNKITLPEAVFAVCHEIGHSMWEHMARGKRYHDLGFDGNPFIPILWNVATDYAINDMLVKSNIGSIKRDAKGNPEWLLDPKYTCDMSGEEIYRLLYKEMKGGKGMFAPGKGDPTGQDTHVFSTEVVSEAEMKRAVQTAVDTAKAYGKLPAALKRYADEFLESKVSWQEMLRTTVVTSTTRDTSDWARPHRRRMVNQGVYLARPASYGCNMIAVFVDTSGSIGQRELNVFFSELADIIRTCRPESVWVLGVDSQVASFVELPGDVDITTDPPEVGGGGGTDFNPPFEWIKQQGLVPDCAVYFTDMMGPFPTEEPPYPTIWCATTETEAPFGTTIHIDVL